MREADRSSVRTGVVRKCRVRQGGINGREGEKAAVSWDL